MTAKLDFPGRMTEESIFRLLYAHFGNSLSLLTHTLNVVEHIAAHIRKVRDCTSSFALHLF